MGQSPNSKNYTDNPKDHILVQGNADMKDGQVHPRIWTTEITKIADKGDLILSVRAPVGDIGKTSYDVVIGRGVAAIKGNEFIFQLLKRMKTVGYWTKYSTGSTFESINSLEINNAVINLPKEHEQNKVGKILSYMDHAITLHEEKKRQLERLKSALLQKMFANKSGYPVVRFEGFSDEWEQCKLGDVAKITMGQSPNSKNYTDNPKDHILVQGNADMKDGQVHPRIWTTEITKIADKGDLILSVRAPVGDIGKTSYDVVIGRGVAAIKGNEFIFQLLKRMKTVGYWTKYSTGSTFESINSLEIDNAVINLPKEHEQNKVGKILSYMDHAITLHDQKLNLLKLVKQSLLQNMFI
ncbi:MAG: restriction endonuclease subunit S [Lactobacillus delbrueckii subsp. lactis]|uniref:Restriction endonuclease subunit S n=1 Tax=Lactobacillus delbrueckii subsp. lactis TaxID=29397 RepID=A0A3G6JGB2_LACDL|nr:MAG: restriction endonuclease subunit S [Lactobacillus delbrueckii subsp. lactis]